jgi:hypothetical protein
MRAGVEQQQTRQPVEQTKRTSNNQNESKSIKEALTFSAPIDEITLSCVG